MLMSDNSYEIPDYFMSGRYGEERIRNGITLSTFDFTLAENMATHFVDYSSSTYINILLSVHCKIDFSASQKHIYEYDKPQGFLGKNINTTGIFSVYKDTPLQMVTISLSDEAIIELTRDCEGCDELVKAMTPSSEGFYVIDNWENLSEVIVAARQVMSCTEQMASKQLYLEGKVLEILALQFEKLLSLKKAPKTLNSGDFERIHAAKDILFANIIKPPTLIDLSRQVGINNFKLKKGFKEVFGNTAYSLLREYRMQKAKEFLLGGNHNMEEVAELVGYSSANHLSIAFKKYYGMSPHKMICHGLLQKI